MATINSNIKSSGTYASLDAKYGPYDSLQDALDALYYPKFGQIVNHLAPGLTIGIYSNNRLKVVEYIVEGNVTSQDITTEIFKLKQTDISGKADASSVYTKTEVDNALSNKINKVTGATGKLPKLKSDGTLESSGINASTVITDISGKADKVNNATANNFAALDGNGNLIDSGKKSSDFATSASVSAIQRNYVKTTTSGDDPVMDSSFDPASNCVRFDESQTNSEQRKQLARDNIGALNINDLKTINNESLFGNGNITVRSAYEEWLAAGNTGTEQEFLASLKAQFGNFIPADYGTNGVPASGGSDITPSVDTLNYIYLVDNDANIPTAKTMWITVVDDSDPNNITYSWTSIGDVQVNLTFATGQAVNTVKIKDENGVEVQGTANVLSAEAGAELRKTKAGVIEEQSSNVFVICDPQGNVLLKINKGFEITDDGHIIIKDGFDSTKIDLDALKEELNGKIENSVKDAPKVYDESQNVFTICDPLGNVVAKINNGFEITSDGHIKIKDGFDSKRDKFKVGRAVVPHIDYKKTEFRWLDIGNSHSGCALNYLLAIAESQGVDLSNVAFCTVARGGSSFADWVAGYHDDDTSGTGDALTGGFYDLRKLFGSLPVKVTGNTYTEINGAPSLITNRDVTRSTIRFWGGDCSILRSLLQDNQWDLITIHQRYIYNEVYDESNGWIDYLTEPILPGDNTTYKSGGLNEFMNILRTTNPSAAIGYLFALVPFGYNGKTVTYDTNSLSVTNATFKRWSESIKKFIGDSGVDFIIPCDTALENLRNSSVPNEPNEWGNDNTTPLTVEERWGFNYDNAHTVPIGVAAYTMSAVAWEVVFAPRFNKSIYGNSLHELKSNDNYIYSSGDSRYHLTIHPTYTENGVEQSTDYSDVWVGITKATVDSENEFSDRATSTVRLTDDNRGACQMAAICAVNDMWNINTDLTTEL